ncbi:hypothetical protein T07_12680 [Trichinella nelsoni]|uniref:Uncharacterized protein n=1 Tax=Trichinella nelsoni TaxID=6336 RepID=A0A0V0SB13_9BILA|nr:hypothetical protein T07_12680 [Trichinella nelsoni]
MIWYMLLAEVTENTICKHRLEKSTASSVDIVTWVAAPSLMDNQIFHLQITNTLCPRISKMFFDIKENIAKQQVTQ